MFCDTYYSAELWLVFWKQMAADRVNVGRDLMKQLYKIGCGAGFVLQELLSLEDERNLLGRPCPQPLERAGTARWMKDTELINATGHMLEWVDEAPEIPVQWNNDQSAFMIRCLMMVRE